MLDLCGFSCILCTCMYNHLNEITISLARSSPTPVAAAQDVLNPFSSPSRTLGVWLVSTRLDDIVAACAGRPMCCLSLALICPNLYLPSELRMRRQSRGGPQFATPIQPFVERAERAKCSGRALSKERQKRSCFGAIIISYRVERECGSQNEKEREWDQDAAERGDFRFAAAQRESVRVWKHGIIRTEPLLRQQREAQSALLVWLRRSSLILAGLSLVCEWVGLGVCVCVCKCQCKRNCFQLSS